MVNERRSRLKIYLLFAVTLLGAFLRLYRIDRLPPGDRYDPAFYGIEALRVLRGEHPIFFSARTGQHYVEPLFSYLMAVCFLVVGASTMAIHLTSALVGLLTVPAVYLAGEALFANDESALRRWGGLISALMIAVSYWHLNWSRYGVRAILVPLFAASIFYFLWRGLHGEGYWAFVMCGISLGLSMYTYEAARLLPMLVIVGFAGVIWERRTVTRRDWRAFLVVTAVALLAFTPLGYYFWTHPGSFSFRIKQAFVVEQGQDVSGGLRAILDQTLDALLAFNVAGDPTPFSTIPGRPSLNPFLSLLFCLGIVISLARLRRPAYLFLLAWLGLMFVPAALAGKGPTAKRAIGTLPAVAMLIAVGALAPWRSIRRWTADHLPGWSRWLRPTWGLILAAGFIYSGIATYRDYFVIWASNPNLFTHFQVGLSAIGEYVGDLPDDEGVYISPELPNHPAIRFHSGLREDIQGYNGRVCLVAPGETTVDTTYVIVPRKDGRSLDLLRGYFPQGRVVDEGPLHYDRPYFMAYRIPAGAEAKVIPSYSVEAKWSDRIRFLGYDLDRRAYEAGDSIRLTLYYQGLRRMERHYKAFAHLLGPRNPATEGPLWGQRDGEPCRGFYPTTSWRMGEIVVDRIELSIPDDALTGAYDVATGFYEMWTRKRLPVIAEDARTEHDVVFLEPMQITGTE